MRFQIIFICLLLWLVVVGGISVQASFEIDVNKNFQFDKYSLNITGFVQDTSLGFSELNVSLNTRKSTLIIGRHKIKLGPGYFSSLMLSDNTSLDLLYHENNYKFFNVPIQGQMLVAMIDKGINKQLFAHRISNNTLIPGFELALSESMMVHKKIHPAYYIPSPFWPYYLTSKLIGLYSEFNYYDDKYIGIDFTYTHDDGSKLYGELLVDEYPWVSYAKNPHKVAHLIGLYYVLTNDKVIRVEYSNVYNYVYVHRFPENVYLNNGKPLGHWLGPDSEVVDIELEKTFANKNIFTIGLRHIRMGIGSFDEDYGADHLEKQFMSEVTKRELIARLGYEKELNDFMAFNLLLELGKSFDQINNTSEGILTFDVNLQINL